MYGSAKNENKSRYVGDFFLTLARALILGVETFVVCQGLVTQRVTWSHLDDAAVYHALVAVSNFIITGV